MWIVWILASSDLFEQILAKNIEQLWGVLIYELFIIKVWMESV